MTLPSGAFVVTNSPASPLAPDSLGRIDLTTDYERGGVNVGDTSGGLNIADWRLSLVGDEVRLSKDPYASETVLFSGVGITEVSLAFDQNMRAVVAYVQDSLAKLWWYDAAISSQKVTTLTADARSPFLTMDDKRETAGATNDILMFYLRGTATVYYRMQRDKYATEYTVCTFPSPVTRITRVGMGRNLRMQVEVELT